MDSILRVENLSKVYKGFRLDNVSLDLQPGYVMGLIGANGAGKSTLISCILNLVVKSKGKVFVGEYDLDLDEDKVKDQIGYVIDNGWFNANYKIKYYAKLFRTHYTKWDEEIFQKYVKEFNINLKKYVGKLSTGEMIKFQLAVALSHDAKLLLLDEPSASLDPVFRRELYDILLDVIKDGDKSVLISTHVTDDLDAVADYITYIDEGKLVFSETKEELNDKYRLVKGSLEELVKINKSLLIGCKGSGTGFVALTSYVEKVKNQGNVIVEIPKIDDIMYHLYLEKEGE